jgi:streptomycin 6-kinase
VAEPSGGVSLAREQTLARQAARHWGLALEPPFRHAVRSYAAPSGDLVVKVPYDGDDESLHEAAALALWGGVGAVRLVDRFGGALLEERALPGDDLSTLREAAATAAAVALAEQLWVKAQAPFRPVLAEVRRWLDQAPDSPLRPLARELVSTWEERDGSASWVVHGDFHHYNVLRHGDRWVAIDPKPYAADREYDVPTFLWNPLPDALQERDRVERRIEAFVAAGLDEFRIRAWTVVRGAYLQPGLSAHIAAIFAG